MQFTNILISLVAFSFFRKACADSVPFTLLSIFSGSVLQYASIAPNEDNILQVVTPNHSTGVITDEGFFKINNNTYVYINEKDQYAVSENKCDAISGFSIRDANINFKYPFAAHNQTEGWILYSQNQSPQDIGIAIAAITSNGSFAPDFIPNTTTITTTTLSPA
ncbi:hypothetical protein ACO0OL_001615 [Hanseniaspora opuntiae]|jgi:hypothetical protein|uniref:Cell wall protein CWP1 n=1 Tax=Hanseniaspora opuntiae TaxID=211096 RepID=A0A1E5RXM4_9ASCO|nr:Cell wall protein CWP1 [Hanseniaspora opuntiae]